MSLSKRKKKKCLGLSVDFYLQKKRKKRAMKKKQNKKKQKIKNTRPELLLR